MKEFSLYFCTKPARGVYWKSYKTEKQCYDAIRDIKKNIRATGFIIKKGELVSSIIGDIT